MTGLAQSSDAVLRDKITNAVMKVYDDQLAKDPNDYNTLFARAHQHYYNGDYTSALADVNQALLITPKTDSELRFDEYILRARISDARKDYVSELADLRLAQEIQPKSLACTDLIAKANLKAGNLNAAEKAFKTILRAESMIVPGSCHSRAQHILVLVDTLNESCKKQQKLRVLAGSRSGLEEVFPRVR